MGIYKLKENEVLKLSLGLAGSGKRGRGTASSTASSTTAQRNREEKLKAVKQEHDLNRLALNNLQVQELPPTVANIPNSYNQLEQALAANPEWLRERIKTLNRGDMKKLHQAIVGNHNDLFMSQQVATAIYGVEINRLNNVSEAIKIGIETLEMMSMCAIQHSYRALASNSVRF